ncbi:MAG: TonB-dependent receptor [Bacteroidota bacterium]
MKTKFNGVLTLFLAFVVQFTFAQEKTISGNVTDETGPLPGVSILIEGTTQGTETDFDGNYTITAKTGDVLRFSFVGMTTVTKMIGTEDVINVSMVTEANTLDEVVVTAYGTQKKESLTGSITEIKSDEFVKVASGNAVAGLTGKVAGVQIFSNSGQPGEAPIVRFRGIGSLNGSSNPLYVVDGVPFAESITTINPNDIESMSFVKDASAAALYGNRGANGVVIITTKKGKLGKMNVTLDFKSSITDRAIKDYDVITNSAEYFEAYHKMLKNNEIVLNGLSAEEAGIKASNDLLDGELGLIYNPYGGDRTSLVDPSGNFMGGTPLWEDDWRDYLFNNNGDIQNTYLSVSGGSENTKYFFSLGHEDNKGYNINTGFKRTTVKSNIEASITDHFKTGATLNYTNRKQKGTLTNNITGNFAWVRNIAPIYPVYARDHNTGDVVTDDRGNKLWDWADVISPNAVAGRPFNGFSNPHALQTLNVNERVRDNFSGKAFISYDFFNDFNFTYNFGYDLASYNLTNYTNKLVGSASSTDIAGRLNEEYGRGTTLTNQQLLSWKKNIDLHNFDVLLGHESSKYGYKNLDVDLKRQFLTGDLSPDLFALPDGTDAILGEYREYDLEGYFSRLMYNFDNKYYINGSFRRDGSSVFHPDNRWGNFYGAGVAWRVSQENFMDDADWVNELKLKASFGQQGNDIVYYPNTATRNYAPYLDQWAIVKNGDAFDIEKDVFGNKDLTWETSNNFNVGFELGLFENRLTIESEYFIRKISDLIHNRELPSSTGFPSVPENVMDMENNGFEMLISYQAINTQDMQLSFNFNATHYTNEITKMVPNKEHIDNGRYRWTIGGSAYDYYMRKFVGVNPENGNAIWETDLEIDPATEEPTNGVTESYSVATEYLLGKTALPDVYGGFSTNFVYKNFDFGMDFSFQIGGYAYDAIYNDGFDGGIGYNFHKDYEKTWTWDNTTATLPRIDTNTENWNQFSDFYLEEADYFSLNNISIGYTIPEDTTNKVGISKVRIYGNANNIGLWTASDRQGFDPRQRVAGDNNAVRYAALKTFTLGLTLNF